MSRPAFAIQQWSQSLPPLSRALMGLTVVVSNWEMRRHTRKALRKLDIHLLKDVGLDQARAEEEFNKPFWWK